MRLIVRRGAFAPLVGLCVTAAIAGSASVAWADPAFHVTASAMRSRAIGAANARVLTASEFEGHARAALRTRSTFAAARSESLVATTTDRFGDGEAIVRFEQTHRGLPVIGRGAAVRLSESGAPILTAIDLEEDLPSTLPSLSAGAAASIAARGSTGNVTAKDAHLVVWPHAAGGSVLAYAVLPQIPAGIPMSPRIIVDAQTGKVIERRDMVRFAKAKVHRFNPQTNPTTELLDLAITPTGDKLTSPFLLSLNCVDRKSVRDLSVSGFKAKVHTCDVEQLATANAEGDFLYSPSDVAGAMASRSDEYSEVSMYYHTAKAYAFFRGLQGSPDAQVVNDKPLRVVANLQIPAGIASGDLLKAADPETPLEPFSNAFFSPAGGGLGAIFQQLYGFKDGGLWFGQGPQRDYAYDGDVVYHEFGHAVVDATLKLEAWHIDARGVIDSPGAMNEALADYFSSAITGDPDVGEYASKDISQNSGVIRTLANQDKCPSAVIGQVHFDSTLFSGALWDARKASGDGTKFDTAIYKAMRTNPGRGDLGYDDLGKLFLATLGTDFPAGASALDASFKSRGILPSCERVLEAKEGGVKAIDFRIGGYGAPGLQSVPDAGELVPGLIQVHAKVAATDGKLVVSFKAPKASSAPASPLGGGGTPFTPVALVKFGKPITWTTSRGNAAHDADKAVDMPTGTTPSATFEVPAGATDVYVQIGNKGDSDGAYDALQVVLGLADGVVPEPAPVDATTPPAKTTTTEEGCAVVAPGGTTNNDHGSSVPVAGLFAGLALAAGIARRRRR